MGEIRRGGSLFVAITPPAAARRPQQATRWIGGLGEGLATAAPSPDDGVQVILQVRDKEADDNQCLRLLDQLRRAFPHLRIVLNGAPSRAARLGFDGHHRTAAITTPVEATRAEGGDDSDAPTLVGQSSHSLEEANCAIRCGVDYVLFGPVFDTPAKRPFGPPQGLQRLREVCAAVAAPVVAIGGIDGAVIADTIGAGAAGVAAIRAAGDPVQVEQMMRALRRAASQASHAPTG